MRIGQTGGKKKSLAGQTAQERTLLSLCARFTFVSASKSVRHLFAKDMLEVMKAGESVDRVYACKALRRIKSPGPLGRFNNAMVYQSIGEVGKESGLQQLSS